MAPLAATGISFYDRVNGISREIPTNGLSERSPEKQVGYLERVGQTMAIRKNNTGVGDFLRRHVGFAPNPISKRSQTLRSRIRRRPGHHLRLPVLRGGLQPAGLSCAMADHRHRGQPRQPHQRRAALPQRRLHLPARSTIPTARRKVLYRAPRQRPLGGAPARLGDGAHRAAGEGGARRRLPDDRRQRRARQPAGERSRTSAGPRSTTKKTT